MSFLLSVVIPTRNRQKYALAAVEQIYSVTDERVQIVISDNSDDNSLFEKLQKNISSDRIKYQYTPYRIPGVDNFALGIELSDGEYVCCIGDDDGVMRYICEFVEFAKLNEIEAITPELSAVYYWPGVSEEHIDGYLVVNKPSADNMQIMSPENGLNEVIRRGGVDCYLEKVAKAYHGIIKKDCFERIYSKTGRYCGGLSPDVYLSTALSLSIEKVLFLGIPLTISGICNSSTSADDKNNRGYHEKLKDSPFLIKESYVWSKNIPNFYCSNTMWADSLMQALNDMGEVDRIKLFDLALFTHNCIARYPRSKKNARKFYYDNDGLRSDLRKIKSNSIIKSIPLIPKKIFVNLPPKLKKIVKKVAMDTSYRRYGVENIIEAEEITFNKIQNEVSVYCNKLKKET